MTGSLKAKNHSPVTPELYTNLNTILSFWETEPSETQKENISLLRYILADLETAPVLGEIDLKNIINRFRIILDRPLLKLQGNFFPSFRPQKSVELKKNFTFYFFLIFPTPDVITFLFLGSSL